MSSSTNTSTRRAVFDFTGTPPNKDNSRVPEDPSTVTKINLIGCHTLPIVDADGANHGELISLMLDGTQKYFTNAAEIDISVTPQMQWRAAETTIVNNPPKLSLSGNVRGLVVRGDVGNLVMRRDAFTNIRLLAPDTRVTRLQLDENSNDSIQLLEIMSNDSVKSHAKEIMITGVDSDQLMALFQSPDTTPVQLEKITISHKHMTMACLEKMLEWLPPSTQKISVSRRKGHNCAADHDAVTAPLDWSRLPNLVSVNLEGVVGARWNSFHGKSFPKSVRLTPPVGPNPEHVMKRCFTKELMQANLFASEQNAEPCGITFGADDTHSLSNRAHAHVGKIARFVEQGGSVNEAKSAFQSVLDAQEEAKIELETDTVSCLMWQAERALLNKGSLVYAQCAGALLLVLMHINASVSDGTHESSGISLGDGMLLAGFLQDLQEAMRDQRKKEGGTTTEAKRAKLGE